MARSVRDDTAAPKSWQTGRLGLVLGLTRHSVAGANIPDLPGSEETQAMSGYSPNPGSGQGGRSFYATEATAFRRSPT
jgi:hypothetical protein